MRWLQDLWFVIGKEKLTGERRHVHARHRGGERNLRRRSQRQPITIEHLEERTLLSTSIPLNPQSWTLLGPAPIKDGQVPGRQPTTGRLVAVAGDPTSANVIYVAAAGGGVWKTVNGGTNWTPLTDTQDTLFMGALALAPSNSNIIYAGTGEANRSVDSFYGRGVLKSTDAGATWKLLGSTEFNRRTISAIVVDPNDPNTVYVAVAGPGINGLGGNTGIWKSSDGGTRWTNTTENISSRDPYRDLAMDPSNPLTLYAAVEGKGVYTTINGGQSWSLLAGGLPSGTSVGNSRIAISNTSPQTLYVSIANPSTGGLYRMMKTTNGGTTWTQLTNVPNYLGGQGWYDSTLAVDPANANIVYAGGGGDPTATGSLFIMTTNGGVNWTDISGVPTDQTGPHADHHGIGFDANGRLLVGNDGGIWRLDDRNIPRWTDLNGNLATIQFTGVALHPTNPNIAYGGSQDNGTEQFNDALGWDLIQFGDGGFVRVDKANPNRVYHTFFNVSLQRSDDGGRTWLNKTSGIGQDPSRFYVPYVMDPANSNRLLLGTNRVYESTNGADNWSAISQPSANGWDFAEPIDSLAAAPTNVNTIYAANGVVFVTTNRGASWTRTLPQTTNNAVTFADILVDPTSSQVAYVVAANFSDVTGGGHVWRTTNGGGNWSDISGNLPDLPTWSIELDPKGPGSADDVLYVGNDNGVYVSSNLGGAWSRFGDGLPNVQVKDLELNTNLGILAAGTHGRGLWEISLANSVANDRFADASTLTGSSVTTTGSNVAATKETGEPNHARNAGGKSVWWTWTAPASGSVTVSTSGSNFDSVLAVYAGSTVAALTEVSSNDDFGGAQQSQLNFTATDGTTYRIAVDGFDGASGSIALALTATAATTTNDNFANAHALSGSSVTTTGANQGATKEAGEPNHAGNAGGKSVWWTWTAPAAGNVTISTSGSNFDSLLAVYAGSTVAALTEVSSNDDFGGTQQSQVSFTAAAGTTYRIAVDGFDGAPGNISLALTETVAVPANDNLANAIALSGSSVNTMGSNVGASKEAGEPDHARNTGGKSVWWTWTAPASGNVTIASAGSNFDTLLGVYTGSSVAGLTEVVSNDNFGGNLQSQVSFAAVAGTVYRIAVDGFAGTSGNITLALSATLTAAPGNDNFANASILNGSSVTTTGSNLGATKETGEPNHAGSGGGKSVWWTWTASDSGSVTISTAGSSFDTLLAVYTGSSIAALTAVASNDNSGKLTVESEVNFAAVAGTAYRIAVDGAGGASGSIRLALTEALTSAPANDNLSNAIILSGNTVTVMGSSLGATKETGEPNHAGNPGGKSVWWSWTAPAAGSVTISTTGSRFDTLLAVYTGSSVTGLTELASNDNSGGTFQSQVNFTAVAGTTYRIAVDGSGGASGEITLGLIETVSAPLNDNFANAIALSGSSVSTAGSNLGATKEPGEPIHAGNSGGSSVWWTWTAPDSGTVTISTAGSNFDTLLAVYTGLSVTSLSGVASNDNFGGTLQSQVSFNALAGTTYRIAVDGSGGVAGSISLDLSEALPTPANDIFSNAITLSGSSVSTTGSNVGATKQTGEPNHAGNPGGTSVWWSWIAPGAGTVTISTGGSNFDTLLAVYTGLTVSGLTELVSNDDLGTGVLQSQITFTAAPGTNYRIAVDGFDGATGSVSLTLMETVATGPANDNFANASTLSGTSIMTVGSNQDATKELGEPDHAGNSGGTSVWWTWTAPAPGTVTISTTGSNFDTLLGVYTGSAISALTEVASNDDFGVDLQSQVTFTAVAARTYRVAVEGFLGAFGNITLALTETVFAGPANDAFANASTLTGTSVSTTGSNLGATRETGEPDHAGQFGGRSAWWTWTAPGSGSVTILTSGSNFDTLLAVYTGFFIADLSGIAGNDDFGGTGQSQVSFFATAGTIYQIAVDGFFGDSGDIALAVNQIVVNAPTNDDFADASSLTGTAVNTTGSNQGATKEPGEPNHADRLGGTSVWWTWTAPDSGSVIISTSGSDFDTLLAVYTGASVASLTEVASNDDFGGLLQSQVAFAAVAGANYRISVDGYFGDSGGVALVLTEDAITGPPNDDFVDADTLTGGSALTTGSNQGATREIGEPDHASGLGSSSVWWIWTAPDSGSVTISTAGSDFDTLLAVYTGSAVSALTELASNDDFGLNLQSQVTFAAVAGTTYRVAVDGWFGDSGNITLALDQTITAKPTNDNFTDATLLSGTSTNSSGSNVTATKETSEPNHAGNSGGRSVWWTWTAPSAGSVTISTAGSNFDTLLAVYTGSTLGTLSAVASNDDFVGRQSQVTFSAVSGTIYQIAVDGFLAASGNITLALTESAVTGPANNHFASPQIITLTGKSIKLFGTNADATKEPGEPDHAGATGGQSVWWTWTAPQSRRAKISTKKSNFDTVLAVYTGSSVGSLTLVASNDDSGRRSRQSQVSFLAVAGVTYQIAVDGFGGASGTIVLSLKSGR